MAVSSDDKRDEVPKTGESTGNEATLNEFKEIEEVKELISRLPHIHSDQIAIELTYERFLYIIDLYQEQPHLLDPHLEYLVTELLKHARDKHHPVMVMHQAFKYLYLISKVRGFKVVVRFLPHEVADVEPVLAMLTEQKPFDFETWETRYMLLLWLAIVCMIPFDMSRLDSFVAAEGGGAARAPVMDRIISMAQTYLGVVDKCRDAAAYALSCFLTRPDVKQLRLPQVMDDALKTLGTADQTVLKGVNTLAGTLSVLALLFKHGKRQDLLQYASAILEKLESIALLENKNTILRKAAVKLVQRLGTTFLKFRIAAWRYQRGQRSLAENLSATIAANPSAVSSPQIALTKDEDEEYDIPDEIEDVIEQLLGGLKDKDTVVRWSSAKGIGRITGRLPRELADEVVGSTLELFNYHESDGAWHGGCLALAELGRRGLLLPERLPDVVPVVLKALIYDERKGNFSVGSHVRDAACYVCWAFARAYEPEQFKAHVDKIANALVVVSIFDREVNVRRAASAAFQENVGRQGSFPHGIDILTTCDYFSVGNRNTCYLELSVFVGQFPEYTQALIDHLIEVKVQHWDSAIRELTSHALHNLTALAPQYMVNTVLPMLLPLTTGIDLYYRHGAILAVAEITHSLSRVAKEQGINLLDLIPLESINGMKEIAKKLDAGKMYQGMNGELMIRAVSCLIEKLSLARLPFHEDPIIDVWHNLLKSWLKHVAQTAAASALPAFFTTYCCTELGEAIKEKQDEIVEVYLKELRTGNEQVRIGYCQAFAGFPAFLLHGVIKPILAGLTQTLQKSQHDAKWAEGRTEAVKAITSIVQTVGIDTSGSSTKALSGDSLYEIYDTLFSAMHDYTVDSRGDVGAWVREASMTGLCDVTSLVVTTAPQLLSQQICCQLFCCVVQQGCEKIDRTRGHAGNLFCKLIYHEPAIPHVPHLDALKSLVPENKISVINWSAPADTFPLYTKLLSMTEYRNSVLLGLTVSVGGLTESLVRHSSACLSDYLHTIENDERQMSEFADTLIKIFKDHLKDDRVSVPMFKMLDLLLSKGCFEVFATKYNPSFPLLLLTQCKQEINRSSDPQKLMASADVFCDFLQFTGDVHLKALNQLMIFLCHKYPRVRKTTAEKLYEAVITYSEAVPEESLDDVMTILSETNWDDPTDKIRPIRNQLCDLLNIPKPVSKNIPKPPPSQ